MKYPHCPILFAFQILVPWYITMVDIIMRKNHPCFPEPWWFTAMFAADSRPLGGAGREGDGNCRYFLRLVSLVHHHDISYTIIDLKSLLSLQFMAPVGPSWTHGWTQLDPQLAAMTGLKAATAMNPLRSSQPAAHPTLRVAGAAATRWIGRPRLAMVVLGRQLKKRSRSRGHANQQDRRNMMKRRNVCAVQ